MSCALACGVLSFVCCQYEALAEQIVKSAESESAPKQPPLFETFYESFENNARHWIY